MKNWIRKTRFAVKAAFSLENTGPILWCHFLKRQLPPLQLGQNIVLQHNPDSNALFLVGEIVTLKCYTTPGFYTPADGDVVFDVGANIGTFSLHLQSLSKSVKVFAVEPAPATREVLERNVTANNISSQVTVLPFAVGSENGKISLHCSPEQGHSSFVEGEFVKNGTTVEVPMMTLPTVLDERKIEQVDLLKIDIEGAETDLFDGMTSDGWKKVKRVTMETHDKLRPGTHGRVLEELKKHDFVIHSERNQFGLGYINAFRSKAA
jgi:FkbM family methyltransferase